MTHRKIWLALGLFCLTPVSLMAAPKPADIVALSNIEAGLWDLKSSQGRDVGRTMCLSDPAAILQLGHPGRSCSRFPVVNEPRRASVHYVCFGSGQGQTDIRIETPRLLQIETQGFVDQNPFSYSFEARRIGDCNRPKP